eukprot:GHVU01091352.1.p1 GENE.GHVU01091352.1~~GHVU01091352.1.p1  ORF type:complete len:425 (+),score=32.85 GHVU01091352.1:202-1476(+)
MAKILSLVFLFTLLDCSRGIFLPTMRKRSASLNLYRALQKKAATGRVDFAMCSVKPADRQDCGKTGIKRRECESRECCWGETKGVPWCYHTKSMNEPRCLMEDDQKMDCGFMGIHRDECVRRGCCWRPGNQRGTPWCYTAKGHGDCGKPAIPPATRHRIVGGKEAIPHSWPWQASLWDANDHFCGGSFIAPGWVLTAAHCKIGYDRMENSYDEYSYDSASASGSGSGDDDNEDDINKNKKVVLGQHSRTKHTKETVTVYADKIIVHEDYDRGTLNNDVMLIKLSDDVKYKDEVSPVCLPRKGQKFPVKTPCYVTGWGDLEQWGDDPDVLHQVMVPIMDWDECNSDNMYEGKLTDAMICGGFKEGGKDSCQGDSGGPYVCYVDDHWVLAGIVSWGHGCAKQDKPGLYTNVAKFTDWIEKTIKANS